MSKAKMPERKSSRRTLVLAFTLGIACTLGANALMSTARANQPFMDAALASLRAARASHQSGGAGYRVRRRPVSWRASPARSAKISG
ncbi:MAG: hypothetical protein B7Y61_17510 [Rhizobiales bacterium 35-66-30]|nr:MAG: hypothetical protein B7Y61_17510 [Rhizobiales bacterium 35-66-30]